MSRKPLLIFTVLFLILININLIFFVRAASPETTNWISLGSKNGTFGAGLGARNGNIGWEISFSNTEDYLSSQLQQGSVPPGALSLGEKNINGSYGVDILRFFPAEQGVTLYAGAGAYLQSHSEVFKQGSRLYSDTIDTKVKFAYSGGVKIGRPGGINLGVGYHSVRGTNGQVYIKF